MNNKSFTMTVSTGERTPFVFLKFFPTLVDASNWARDEITMKDAEFILIREGEYASDPVVWDSRTAPKLVPYCWTGRHVPTSFPLQCVNERFEAQATSILSDYESKVDLSTWQPHEKEGFRDYRYKQPGIRAAWMMYLDLALEHFDRFGTVV